MAYGVRSYIFVPCVVYGEGEGFGNRISIQTTAIVRAAQQVRRLHSVDRGHAVRSFLFVGDVYL
jgi:nucleoside-diphosphate-sugar epimerase